MYQIRLISAQKQVNFVRFVVMYKINPCTHKIAINIINDDISSFALKNKKHHKIFNPMNIAIKNIYLNISLFTMNSPMVTAVSRYDTSQHKECNTGTIWGFDRFSNHSVLGVINNALKLLKNITAISPKPKPTKCK